MCRSHEMNLNLKFGNLRYLHVSNLQVLLIILIFKSCIYSKTCGCNLFLKVACAVEAILRKSAPNTKRFKLMFIFEPFCVWILFSNASSHAVSEKKKKKNRGGERKSQFSLCIE